MNEYICPMKCYTIQFKGYFPQVKLAGFRSFMQRLQDIVHRLQVSGIVLLRVKKKYY